jgi:hypothetical protein
MLDQGRRAFEIGKQCRDGFAFTIGQRYRTNALG